MNMPNRSSASRSVAPPYGVPSPVARSTPGPVVRLSAVRLSVVRTFDRGSPRTKRGSPSITQRFRLKQRRTGQQAHLAPSSSIRIDLDFYLLQVLQKENRGDRKRKQHVSDQRPPRAGKPNAKRESEQGVESLLAVALPFRR